jgi:hypothetical protein
MALSGNIMRLWALHMGRAEVGGLMDFQEEEDVVGIEEFTESLGRETGRQGDLEQPWLKTVALIALEKGTVRK